MVEIFDKATAEFSFAVNEHREMREGVDKIHEAANLIGRVSAPNTATALWRVREWIATVLVPHAAWEDAVLYPEIVRRTGTEWSTKLMRYEHEQIERAALKLDADIELARGTLTHEAVCEIRGHLLALEALLRAHMEREEHFLLPVLAEHSEPNGPPISAGRHVQ